MGQVFAKITITNHRDLFKAKEGLISENDVRSITLTALVDTGATTLIINDEICNQLGFSHPSAIGVWQSSFTTIKI